MSIHTLQQHIMARIEREGPITFAEYMRMALYEPGYGYYVTSPTKVGFEGDFFTSADLPSFFAHCLGRQLLAFWQELGQPDPFVVLEQGAGRGLLAHAIHAWAEQEQPAFQRVLDYRSADIHSGQDALTTPEDHPAVILANELVDAFPVHIVQKYAGQLYEVYVGIQDGRLYELLDEPTSPEVAAYLDRFHIPWPHFEDGWRAEVNLDALRWIERCAHTLATPTTRRRKGHGFLLTIDYGERARALYVPQRPQGTLTCYHQHRLSERPLARPGEQDITAHVNFTALIDEGRRHLLHLRTLTTQRAWLTTLGIHDELQRVRERDFAIIDSDRASDQGQAALFQWYNLRQRVTTLTDPYGMGNFKVLIMHL